MADIHEGGCLCAAAPGSAFAMVAVFDEKQVSSSGAAMNTYEYCSDESGRRLWFRFCPSCGTTVGFRIERVPTALAISVGTFDDPEWFKINRHIWTRSAQDWFTIPEGTERFEKHFV